MSNPFVGEIRIFAGNFAPAGWAFCNGQLLPISENDALFALIGTTYGGDGQTTFALPDLRGRIPVHAGTGPGLSPRTFGASGGSEQITLTGTQLPSHTHAWPASTTDAQERTPIGHALATSNADVYGESSPPVAAVTMAPGAVANTGGSQPHTNLQPFLCVSFIISLFGIFPSQN